MMFVGITRRIDELGRITIPSEIRKTYQLGKNDEVEILGTEDGILLRVPNIQITKLNEEKD
ncbi:MAG: AbrB/MazE/SpoVT family DNA-binding domain-containing protein [Ruminococcaceae bacterium]|nr:AbrB/MazE/SpoVT family DNA-binding domain-containing protein [Oscillospiraceae bacterium]